MIENRKEPFVFFYKVTYNRTVARKINLCILTLLPCIYLLGLIEQKAAGLLICRFTGRRKKKNGAHPERLIEPATQAALRGTPGHGGIAFPDLPDPPGLWFPIPL